VYHAIEHQTKKRREAVSAAAPISIDPITRRVNNCGNGKCEGGSGASHYWGRREYKWLLSLCQQPHTEHPPKHPQQPLDRRLAMCAPLSLGGAETQGETRFYCSPSFMLSQFDLPRAKVNFFTLRYVHKISFPPLFRCQSFTRGRRIHQLLKNLSLSEKTFFLLQLIFVLLNSINNVISFKKINLNFIAFVIKIAQFFYYIILLLHILPKTNPVPNHF
jgi:hypothetical protein